MDIQTRSALDEDGRRERRGRLGALLLATAIQMLALNELGIWKADTIEGILLIVALFLVVVFTSGLAASLVGRSFGTELVEL